MARSRPRGHLNRFRRGFTLVEALVSVFLLGVGIVATVSTLGQMTRTEGHMQESERMRRLADMKLQELIATGDYQFITSGDFSEQGDARYDFVAALEPTGVESLELLRVTVTKIGDSEELGYEAAQAIYITAVDTGGDTP